MNIIHKCENCVSVHVCKYREEYEAAVKQVLECQRPILDITVKCKWFAHKDAQTWKGYGV